MQSATQRKVTPADIDKSDMQVLMYQFEEGLRGKNAEDLTSLACRYCDIRKIQYQSPTQAQSELLRDFGTSQLSTNLLNEFVLTGYKQSPETWSKLSRLSKVSKLLPEDRIRAGRDTSLPERKEDGAAKRSTLTIQKSVLSPKEYANIIVASREVIFNQGSTNLVSALQEEGASAALTIGNEFIKQLTDNVSMLDGNALFHSTHNNIASVAGAPSVDTINEMMQLLRRMPRTTNTESARTNMPLRYILAPAALEMKIRALLTSQFSSSSENTNPITLLIDSRLDDVSTTAWYGFTDPELLPCFEVAGLQQLPFPNVDKRFNPDTSALEIKVSLDVAEGFIDWRGCIRNAGA